MITNMLFKDTLAFMKKTATVLYANSKLLVVRTFAFPNITTNLTQCKTGTCAGMIAPQGCN